MLQAHLLRAVLILVGMAIMALGTNVGLGGIQTLGWQTTPDFVAIRDASAYHVQDSHIRFIGGIWFCVGAIFLLGAWFRDRLRFTLMLLCGAIAVAGVFRLSGWNAGAVQTSDVLPSLILELIGFPLLAWWLMATGRSPQVSRSSSPAHAD